MNSVHTHEKTANWNWNLADCIMLNEKSVALIEEEMAYLVITL